MDALPLGSYGNSIAKRPAKRIMPPAIYTGTCVSRFAYSAMTGACVRHARLHVSALSHCQPSARAKAYHDACHAGRSGRQAVPRATVLCGKYLCSDGIEHGVRRLPKRGLDSADPRIVLVNARYCKTCSHSSTLTAGLTSWRRCSQAKTRR